MEFWTKVLAAVLTVKYFFPECIVNIAYIPLANVNLIKEDRNV